MPQLKDNKTCALLEQYLSYLVVVKEHSPITAYEYRIDCLLWLEFAKHQRGVPGDMLILRDLQSTVNSNPLASMFGR